jgi:branched-chain amino acid transport system substrate-binding protein
MAEKNALWRMASVLAAGAVLVSACSGSDGGSEDPAADDAGITDTAPQRDAKLDIGFIYAETGGLAFLTPPQRAAIELAITDINAAGGVNGQDVTLSIGDEGGAAHMAREVAAQFVNEQKDAIVGAASSGMSQEFIQMLHDHRVVQCSGSNTSTSFTDQANNSYYFRTVPPDAAVAPLIAEWMVEQDNHSSVAIVFRNDDYGRALEDLIATGVDARDATVVDRIDYDPATEDFSDVVDRIVAADADAVALVAFGEGIPILQGALGAGMDASQFYGGDGLFGTYVSGDGGVGFDDEGVTRVAGMTVFGAAGNEEFNQRLNDALPDGEKGNFIYGGQVYDCAIVIALAAVSAQSVDPAVFNDEVDGVTKDGTPCSSFAECAELLAAGEDIDYEGASGPLEITHPDPTVGGYAVARFQDDGQLAVVPDGSREVDLSQLSG